MSLTAGHGPREHFTHTHSLRVCIFVQSLPRPVLIPAARQPGGMVVTGAAAAAQVMAAQRLSCPECVDSANAPSGSCTTYPKQNQKHGPRRRASGTRKATLLESTKIAAYLSASSTTHLQSLLHRGVQQAVEQRDDFDCLSPHLVQQAPHLYNAAKSGPGLYQLRVVRSPDLLIGLLRRQAGF